MLISKKRIRFFTTNKNKFGESVIKNTNILVRSFTSVV